MRRSDEGIVKDLPLPVLFGLAFGPLLDICRDHILHFIELDDELISRCVEACWDALRRYPDKSFRGRNF